jgi:2-amino-4-hydroxy-6-hydroxymethyldihydropteridine diphosphokinase
MPDVFVGLGSNIDPAEHLRWALGALNEHFGPLRISSVYLSPALGFAGADFLNMVAGFDASTGPDAVETVLSALENERGRDQSDRSGSRTLDLDLLLYGARVDAMRRLPRADVLRYPFVLAPLAEIAPGLIHPVTGVPILAAWRAIAGQCRDLVIVEEGLDAA